MELKLKMQIDDEWHVMTFAELHEAIQFGNNLTANKKLLWSGITDDQENDIFEGDKCVFEIKGLGRGNAKCYFSDGSFWLEVEGQSAPFPLHEYRYRSDIVIVVNNS